MANSYLQRSSANSSASGTTATVSLWVRKHDESAGDGGFFQFWNSGSNFCSGYANPTLKMRNFIAGGYSQGDITCNRKLRDNGAWYHCQFVWDTTNSTAGDRMRLYINGVRETSFSSSTNPSSGYSFYPLEAGTFYLNRYNANTTTGSQSYSHVHYCDGYAYEPTVFGEFDTNGTGEWKIKTSPTCNYGSNGFFILKDGNSTTDQSGNSKTFSTTGTITNTEDCPSNVFSTYNPLDNYYANSTFSNGNTTIVTNSGNTTYNMSTLGIPPTMKCYWEAKFDTIQAANGEVGIVNTPPVGSSSGSDRLYYQTYGISVNDGGAIWSDNADTGITLGTLSTSDVVCFAWDGVNQALYVRKNADAWINSGDPTSGASKTGAVKSFSGTRTMFPAVGDQSGSHAVGTSTNFGNGIFGTTAISSEGTNASGIGKFEYDVPTGYTALSTKGLNL